MDKKRDKVEMTQAEWEAEGERLFGPVRIYWGFVCPSCGHVQTPEDFRQYKDDGASPDLAYLVCIGRWDGHGAVEMCSGKSPCNYTSGGLFNINPVKVKRPSGDTTRAFAFANPSDVPSYLGTKKEQKP